MDEKTRVVAYYRCSTDKQERSVADQRTAVRQFAEKNGYTIVSEFVDEGISGASSERPAFERMLKFCSEQKESIRYVLVYEFSRFSRGEWYEVGHYIHLLKQAGVELLSISDNLNTMEKFGGLKVAFNQEMNHQELERIASRMKRGQISNIKEGYKASGRTPYGYRRAVVDENGEVLRVLNEGEGVIATSKSGKKYRTTLLLGPEEEQKRVKWMFQSYEKGKSLLQIVDSLNRRGIPSPKGGKWSVGSVQSSKTLYTVDDWSTTVIGEVATSASSRDDWSNAKTEA